jgi:hypothetical protein
MAQPMPQQVWFILTSARSLHVRRAVTAAAQAQAQAKNRHVYLDHSDSWRQLEQPRCCEMKCLGALASGLPRGERVTLTMGKLIIPID